MNGHLGGSMSSLLHSPLKIGNLALSHRVVMAPLTRMRASNPGSAPHALNARYYGQRASHGGLIITEATQISWQGKGYPQTPGLHTDEQAAGWRRRRRNSSQGRCRVQSAMACRQGLAFESSSGRLAAG